MTPSTLAYEYGTGWVEAFALPTGQDFLFGLLEDVFANHWSHIVFGSLIQGAVFEIRVAEPPRRISVFDGYLTVDFGSWHFHVCIGPHQGSPKQPVSADLAAHRRTARAEFYRILNSDRQSARSWGLRLFNGNGDQQITVFFPNPFLSEDGDKVLKTPDWSRLAMWDGFRQRYLGLDPDPLDRSGKGFRCGGH
ncbi:MAG: hypothetical protein NVV74_15355 [Magnetospirillum sp.]|nr:hypothetical protein [Magnetospirillum sp.]